MTRERISMGKSIASITAMRVAGQTYGLAHGMHPAQMAISLLTAGLTEILSEVEANPALAMRLLAGLDELVGPARKELLEAARRPSTGGPH